jgi:hypothetical protein
MVSRVKSTRSLRVPGRPVFRSIYRKNSKHFLRQRQGQFHPFRMVVRRMRARERRRWPAALREPATNDGRQCFLAFMFNHRRGSRSRSGCLFLLKISFKSHLFEKKQRSLVQPVHTFVHKLSHSLTILYPSYSRHIYRYQTGINPWISKLS